LELSSILNRLKRTNVSEATVLARNFKYILGAIEQDLKYITSHTIMYSISDKSSYKEHINSGNASEAPVLRAYPGIAFGAPASAAVETSAAAARS